MKRELLCPIGGACRTYNGMNGMHRIRESVLDHAIVPLDSLTVRIVERQLFPRNVRSGTGASGPGGSKA